jgi:cell division protein FtsB
MAMCEECDDLRTSLAGAYNQISQLKERVSELEATVEELQASNQMLRQEVADEKTGEMLHEY